MKFLSFFCFCGSFLPSWILIRIANPETDPGNPLNPDPDTDPQHWYKVREQKEMRQIIFGVFYTTWKEKQIETS
jgi:hypothetical protein